MSTEPSIDARVDPGSFRDPAGTIFHWEGRVFRTVTARSASDYEFIRDTGLLGSLISEGLVIGTAECQAGDVPLPIGAAPGTRYVLEHAVVPLVSYPYEWPFRALQQAAMLHLDLHLRLLQSSATLSDSSAYNVQFIGRRPVFIDVLSIRRYVDGEFWHGHRQFCEQFLNPLVFQACTGTAFNDWYRGQLEGISAGDITKTVPIWKRLTPKALMHVSLQAGAQPKSMRDAVSLDGRRLAKGAYLGMLQGMRAWIAGLVPRSVENTTWADYARDNSYDDDERIRKMQVVRKFVNRVKPDLMLDVGCNTGEFSQAAIESGAGVCVGLDSDHGALDRAVVRALENDLPFLPLYMNLANPSPSQGWLQTERKGLLERTPVPAAMALAVVHHLAIGRNVPLRSVADFLTRLTPQLLVEFVPKEDPMVQLMLRNREDIFPDYTLDAFRGHLAAHGKILSETVISRSGRVLLEVERVACRGA